MDITLSNNGTVSGKKQTGEHPPSVERGNNSSGHLSFPSSVGAL